MTRRLWNYKVVFRTSENELVTVYQVSDRMGKAIAKVKAKFPDFWRVEQCHQLRLRNKRKNKASIDFQQPSGGSISCTRVTKPEN